MSVLREKYPASQLNREIAIVRAANPSTVS